jgi:site-specific DNA recombinase
LYAEAKGWNVVTVYRLDAVSGKTVKEHPEAKRLLADVHAGTISGLIFSKLARLARNTKELLEFADSFREHEADLISLAESIDTSTPAGRLFFTIIAAMGQWEREEIASRVAASVPIRAQMGKSLGGKASYGYQWKDKKLVVDPAEAPVRALVYELFLEFRRKKAVARVLNERGYRTREGAAFSDTTVERLIRDPTAKGQHRVNYSTLSAPGANGKRRWKLKPESEWLYQDVEPVVSEHVWSECNAVLDQQREKGKRPARRPVHLFTGFVFCRCGTKMYVPSNTPKYICFECRTKIPVEDLERIFHEEIKDFLFSPEKIAEHFQQAQDTIKAKAERVTHLEGERTKVQAEIDKLHDLYQADQIDKKGFGARYRPLAARLAQLEDELPATQADLDALRITELSREEIVAGARDLHSAWATFELEEKRQIVEAITERITVSKDEVSIELFAGASPSPGAGGGSKPLNVKTETPTASPTTSLTRAIMLYLTFGLFHERLSSSSGERSWPRSRILASTSSRSASSRPCSRMTMRASPTSSRIAGRPACAARSAEASG